MKLDAAIDRLYGLPLDEFIGERGALAKRLRGDGDREGADRVKGLRKPTVGAWALNMVVRLRPGERDKLLKAGERLRKAHEALLSGGDPSALREAMTAERALAASLADAAEAVATEAGKGGAALKERVRGTLHAAAVDEEIRAELAAGRVVRERDAVGLGPFGATTPPSGSGSTKRGSSSKTAAATRSDSGSTKRSDKKASAADERRAKREEAKQERERAKQERAERAERERERDGQVAAAERSLAAAHAALAKAEAAHEHAAGDLDTAKRVLGDARAAERDARNAQRERAKEVTKRERALEKLRGAG